MIYDMDTDKLLTPSQESTHSLLPFSINTKILYLKMVLRKSLYKEKTKFKFVIYIYTFYTHLDIQFIKQII